MFVPERRYSFDIGEGEGEATFFSISVPVAVLKIISLPFSLPTMVFWRFRRGGGRI